MITKLILFPVHFLALTCVVLSSLYFSDTASANPSKANLSFKYDINGSLVINVKFDSPTTTRCVVRHRSSLYHEGDVLGDKGVIRRSTVSRSLAVGRKSTSLRASGLPGAKVDSNGSDPILAVQARLICDGEGSVDSNVVGRYVICGAGVQRYSLSSYFKILKRKLAKSK